MPFGRVTIGKHGQIAYTEETEWGTPLKDHEVIIRVGNEDCAITTIASARTVLERAMRSGIPQSTKCAVVNKIKELYPDLVSDKRYDRYLEHPLDKVLRYMAEGNR